MCLVSFASTQDNQKDLEMATETLSEYLERDITSECLSDIKQKVQDKYRYLIYPHPYCFPVFLSSLILGDPSFQSMLPVTMVTLLCL